MQYRELSTPVLTVDLDALERNLGRVADLCRRQGVGLRPHTKTHKSVEVSRLQLAQGAVGLTVAKVGEAEVMADAGFDDILVAFPIMGAEKLRRLATIARARRLLVSLDSESAAQQLSLAAAAQNVTIGVLVEFDAGGRRCGLDPGPDLVVLAKAIEKLPGLKFRGLMSYFGNVWGTPEQRRAEAEHVAELVTRALAAFRAEQMPVEIVSGGSTPSAEFAHLIPGLTEIRPGTYAYNDLNTYYQGACSFEDCAVRVVATVVSTAVPGRAIIDAGSKTLTSDLLGSGPKSGYGYIVEAPDVPIIKLNEEHGYLDITQTQHRFHVGDVVTVIPNHVCVTVNMHDEIVTLRQGEAVGCWKVAARGKVR
ncbi:MAG: alanine racemase [Acidobacteriota bacterium]|nr:alanine racemase [Acidobacteriota bacterium]